MTFTPGSDEGRTDTFEAQTATPDRSIDTRVKEEFDDAQNILKQAGEGLYGLGLAGIYAITKSPQAVQAVQALRNKLEGKPFTPPTPNPNNLGGLITLEPITTEEAFTRPDVTGTASEGFDRDLPPVTDGPTNYIYQMYGGSVTPEQKKALSLIKAKFSDTGGSKPSITVPDPTSENQSDYFRRLKTDMQFKSKATTIGKLADQNDALEIAENLLKHVDDGERGLIPGWVASRPTTKYRGKRLLDYTRPDGTPSQLYFNYSASNNSIVAIDYLKRMQTKLSREKWNVNSNSSLGKIADDIWKGARQKNKDLRAVLQDLQTTNPEEFSRIFGTKGVWYVEHLHAQNSPFWDKVRPFSARDPINLMALGEKNFPALKTNIENHMYTGRWQGGAFKKYGTKVYLDYNPQDKTLQLKRADNDEALGAIIDGDTPSRNWQKALKDAEANIPQGDISNVNPDLDPIVDYTDKITDTTAARIPDVGSQPGVAKANIPLNLSKEAQDKIDGYQAEIDQAQKNIDLYNSQFTAVPIKEGVPSLGSKIKKTKSLTSLPLNGPNSVNSNKQIIADRLQKIQKVQAEAQGSLLNSKPGVTQSSGTGLMTNVQEEVPAVQPDKKVKPKKVKKTKQQKAIEDENPLL